MLGEVGSCRVFDVALAESEFAGLTNHLIAFKLDDAHHILSLAATLWLSPQTLLLQLLPKYGP